ncbi:MAG TPA: gamma-glutamyl-gamma-aminobutyrate hydrolase family protein [Solirubrobacterales bacterium]
MTTSEVRLAAQPPGNPDTHPPRTEMVLGLNYLKAIRAAGGMPVVIPPLGGLGAEPVLAGFDGLCLSGGPDIHPSAYGRDPHPALGPTWRDLDEAELAVAREGDERGLPILGLCRGAQVFNVVRGGTLFQHLPGDVGGEVAHRQAGIGPGAAHPIEVVPESALAAALGSTEVEVNSYHHQAPRELGRDLRAVAFAPDGVIEGIEDPGRGFAIGVQWHAEADTEVAANARLFEAFVGAARGARPDPRREAPERAPPPPRDSRPRSR